MTHLFTYTKGTALKLILAFSLLTGYASAQNYPVQAHVVTTGPYLNYLSYYGDENNHLQITLTNTDFTAPSPLVRLRLRFEGQGWEVYTNPNATIGQPILLDAGMPVTITGSDLLPYLLQNNLISPSGIDLNNLPSGRIDVWVDVIRESASQQVLSSNNWGVINIAQYTPPQAFTPMCESVLDTNTMFHNFMWSPPMPMPVGLGIQVLYDLHIYHWVNPENNSVLSGNYPPAMPPIIDIPMNSTQISDFNGILEVGEKYIWTVTARVLSNGSPVSIIDNGGVSAPCTFTYGEELSLTDQLADGLEIELFTEPSAERKGKAWWTVTDNTPNQGLSNFDEFIVEYRKQPTGNEGFEIPWFSKTVTSFEHFIYQLEPSTTYEVKVSGVIAGTVGDPTPVKTFTTPDPRVYNCGESDLPYLPSTYTPLENATVGTQVQIGQFTMTMTEVNEFGGGHYAGKGTIPIAFLGGAKAKVRFDDILIDTEYRVHEGRVDVITEGLESWLDDQLQQFIDPYYVNGVIDSAWVDTVAGVAWVTVDGVDQQFTFDPPHYPIIVNDENGNQYTIYPNGTIVVTSYLAISEEWTANADEVIHFAQNESELRGFDGKEHMQWHENYEIMMLADSSKYFVANKSLAKGEADYVNVEIPSGTSVSFQLSDGTPINASPLQGTWLGESLHTGSAKKTLTLPAQSSTGNYSIYAIVNNQKVGQLNIKVYSKKERELVVVPIASTNLTAAQIIAELDETLGEANIEVGVEITSQWTDTTGTFTASTNISLPTEVGLLTKYSDDMREIRDLYFEQNPNADKSKYYIFLVNGFDDPNELGYMVRGRAMGFVKASQPNVLQTISHELAHGMGALEHSWKDNGPEQGTTSNLMDYNGGNNLIKAQWKELRDWDVVPSLWDGTEDAQNAVVAVNDYDLTEFLNPDGSITFATPSGKPISLKGSISELTFQTLSFFGGHGSLEEGIEQPPFGSLVAFTIDGTAYTMDINETGQFLGYFNPSDSTGTAYSETYSQNNDGVKMCVGLPVFMNGEFGLGVTRCDLAITNISGANTANGTKQEIEWLIDNYCNNLQANSTHVLVANIDYNTDFTEELILLGELMEVIDAHANLSGVQVNTANGTSYEQGHYFGVSAYLIFKLLKMINLNKDAIPCTQFLGERLDDYFNAQLSSQAYQQALATHYSSPINQALEGEYLNIKVQPQVFTQSTSYTDITLVNSASQGVEFLMGLTDPIDINILKRNMILKHFFSQQEQLLNTDNSVNFTFIDNLKAKLHSALYSNQTINEDQRLEVRCLLAGLNYNQRSSLIDYCFSQMNSPTATGTNRAPYAEIVLGALEIAPPSQYSQLRTLISANGYSYYNQLANLVTPNKLYENSSAAFATWVVNGLTSQKSRAIRVIDSYARDKNQAIQSSFDPNLSSSTNGVQYVPLIPMSILQGMSDPTVTSSYSAGSNTYTFEIDQGTETTVTATPFELIQVEVIENFNNSYVVRPDNGQPLKQGDKFLIPASTLHNIIQQNELAVYNVGLKYMLEAAFIVGTGGTGLGILALEVTVMGTQLVIEDNMGDIQYMPESPTKNMILGFRDYADYIVVGAGLSHMMLNGVQRSPFIIKEQVGNDFKFTFKNEEKGMALSRLDEAGELSANITKIRGILNTMDDVTDAGLVTVKKHLEAFELDTRFLQITRNTGAHKVHFSPISKKPYFHYIANEYNPTAFTPKDLFSVEFIANNSKARLTNIQWLSASYSGDVVLVSRMKNTNYQPPGESQFVNGRLEVVKTNTGQLYVRIPEFDVLLSSLRDKFDGHSNLLAWLDEIPEAKINLLKELDQLPSSSYASLDGDIGDVSLLKGTFASDVSLVKSWDLLSDHQRLRRHEGYLNSVKIDFSSVGYSLTDVINHGNHAVTLASEVALDNNSTVSGIFNGLITQNKMTYVEASSLFRYTYYDPSSGLGGSSLANPALPNLPDKLSVTRILKQSCINYGQGGYKLTSGTVTIRGTSLDITRFTEDFEQPYLTSTPISYPITMSSSTDQTLDVATKFINQTYTQGRIRCMIHVVTSNSIYVDDIAHWGSNFNSSNNPWMSTYLDIPNPQLEVLTLPNVNFNVTLIEDKYDTPGFVGTLVKHIYITEL